LRQQIRQPGQETRRYEFLVHGGIHHYGTNVLNLVRRDERWLIAGVANNSQQVRNESVDAYGG
jgi:hypothetical protein